MKQLNNGGIFTEISKNHFFANVLRRFQRIPLLISSTGQHNELPISAKQSISWTFSLSGCCSASSGLLSTYFSTLLKSRQVENL